MTLCGHPVSRKNNLASSFATLVLDAFVSYFSWFVLLIAKYLPFSTFATYAPQKTRIPRMSTLQRDPLENTGRPALAGGLLAFGSRGENSQRTVSFFTVFLTAELISCFHFGNINRLTISIITANVR